MDRQCVQMDNVYQSHRISSHLNTYMCRYGHPAKFGPQMKVYFEVPQSQNILGPGDRLRRGVSLELVPHGRNDFFFFSRKSAYIFRLWVNGVF